MAIEVPRDEKPKDEHVTVDIENYLFKERKLHSMLLILGCTTLLIIGLAPQWFVPLLTRLGGVFIGANP